MEPDLHEKVRWTREMNIELAKYLEDKPFIWDMKHPKFSNSGLRDETFANFAARYDISWLAVKERWINIRSTYGFYMRKIQAKKNKGQDFNVNWFMWKPCKYLYKVYKVAKPKADSKEVKSDENMSDDDQQDSTGYLSDSANRTNVSCEEIVDNIATVFKGVQNQSFDIDNSKYAAVGQAVTRKLSQLNSYEAARLSQKILEILAEYDENNPMNPNKAF